MPRQKQRRNNLLIEWDNKCAYCGIELNQNKDSLLMCTIDHFIPDKRGGKLNKLNMLPACSICNSKKQHKHPAKFIIEEFGVLASGIIQDIMTYFNYVYYLSRRNGGMKKEARETDYSVLWDWMNVYTDVKKILRVKRKKRKKK